MTYFVSRHRLWLTWLWLSVLTLLLAWLADWQQGGHLVAVLALAGAWLKGVAVAEQFMSLRSAPLWLRGTVHGWLLLVCGGLLAGFL
ncbi:cytochrome C oxidase subunit IV family protein [Vogesella sp. LIG4]|uniref:cytochrome C oxidase subunit IV family protein n=1 Tax=Vogesella sp. LIG4 TaxID=1192162 RepID=UPI0008201102|nr:cytochrome C oxidase subunit IV family protein [Vogesella sp. LIG4]SCK19299.1 Cytochrome C oxidase subunit IV [Vogesella sp. LIG4]